MSSRLSLLNQREVLLAAVRRTLHANAPNISPLERLHLNSIWELLVRDNLQMSIELMLTGPPSVYTSILSRLQGDDPETIRLLREIAHKSQPDIPDRANRYTHCRSGIWLRWLC